MRKNQRQVVLEAALALMAVPSGGVITIDGTASRAGMTKAGVMYHFPTRTGLIRAVVDQAATEVEDLMLQCLATPFEEAGPPDRIAAYVIVAASGRATRAAWVMSNEASYRPEYSSAWTERLERWFDLSEVPDPAMRARLTVARLAADGLWGAHATGVFPPQPEDAEAVLTLLRDLTTAGGEQ